MHSVHSIDVIFQLCLSRIASTFNIVKAVEALLVLVHIPSTVYSIIYYVQKNRCGEMSDSQVCQTFKCILYNQDYRNNPFIIIITSVILCTRYVYWTMINRLRNDLYCVEWDVKP